MRTLRLDPATWDLTVDALGNIAVADGAPALAQDAASAIRLFQGELWYDTTSGVPYFASILGRRPPASLMTAAFVRAALTVPGVVAARCTISAIEDRRVRGEVRVTDAAGNVTTAGF